MSTPQHVNMSDVAQQAGVSVATVSRALRDLPGVGVDTRERIKAIADQMSYVVSPEASRLARGATGRVAVVVSKIELWFYGAMLSSIERTLGEAGLDVLVYQLEGKDDRRRFFAQLPARRKADAVIVVTLPVPDTEARRLDLLGMRVVVAGGRMLDYPSIRIDDIEVGRQATQHLIDLGHRRIGMIRSSDPEGVVWAADLARTQGFYEALHAAGIPPSEELLVTEPFGLDGGQHGMEQLLSLGARPSAVFAFSDEIAFGALKALQRAGVTIPEEMSVIGVDDHPFAALAELTTIRQSVGAQGAAAAQLVIDLLEGRDLTETHQTLPTELVVRRTTGPV